MQMHMQTQMLMLMWMDLNKQKTRRYYIILDKLEKFGCQQLWWGNYYEPWKHASSPGIDILSSLCSFLDLGEILAEFPSFR